MFHDPIMDPGAEIGQPVVPTIRVDPVGQQDDHQRAVRIDPDRGSRKAGVAEGGPAE